MSSHEQIKDFQLDVLKEIGNIGAGNAATALSFLVSKPIDMKIPKVKLLSFDELAEAIGGEEPSVGIFLKMQGDLSGSIFFLLEIPTAKQLSSQMFGGDGSGEGEILSEIELSALQEVGNILTGSYLTALSNFTGLNIQPSVPALAIDMPAAIISYGLIESSIAGDLALIIDTTFIDTITKENHDFNGHFVLLPDPDSLKKIFQALGVPFYE